MKITPLLTLAALFAAFSVSAQPSYNTVDAMLSAVTKPITLRTGTTLQTLGYGTVRDTGNPLIWSWDATNTLTTNRFRLQVGTNTVGRLVHKWDWNIRAFGAVGDGITDDTAAINAATEYVLSDVYGELYFPAGTYVHSGWYIFPTTNTLLRIRGQSANPASAVDPYGSRILLKPGSTNDLFTIQFTNDFTKRLRVDVSGMYFDGNRFVCTNARDCVVLSGKPGPATNYISCGQWRDCAFNRGARHGLLVTNHLFQLELDSCNAQSNGDTGVYMDRGGDHKFTKVLLEKAGVRGFYCYKTDNTTFQDCDIGFCTQGIKLDNATAVRFINTDISFHGQSCVEIYGTAAQNNMFDAMFVNCRIGSANASQSGVPVTYPTGTYSAVVLTGDSFINWGHSFYGCRMVASELGSTTAPKYVFEDQRTASTFTSFPGRGVSIFATSVANTAGYWTDGIFSPGFEQNAQIFALTTRGSSYAITNQIDGLELRGRFNSYGIANFGNATNTIPAINVDGGASGTDIQTWNRSGNAKFGLSISGNTLRVNDSSNATQMVAFEDTGSAAIMYLGGNSGTPRTAAIYSTLPSGTDVPSAPIRLYTLGTGAGSSAAAGFDVNLPTVGASGSSAQSSSVAFAIRPPTGKRTPMLLLDPEVGVARVVTTTNLTIYHTNGTVLYTGKILTFE